MRHRADAEPRRRSRRRRPRNPLTFTDPTGYGQMGVPLPNDPGLIGVNAFLQRGVVATPGRFPGTFNLSDALQMQVGQ